MKHDPVFLVQRTNEVAHLRPEDTLHWPFFRRHHVYFNVVCAQGCCHLKPNKTCTNHECTVHSFGSINDRAAIRERTQRVNMRLVGARDRQADGLRASGYQKSIVSHVPAADSDDMAGFGINASDLGIETQIDACLVVEAVGTQRHPILWCLTGKVILRQIRSINRYSGVTAQHDDAAAKLPPSQHLRRGEAGRATTNNDYLVRCISWSFGARLRLLTFLMN